MYFDGRILLYEDFHHDLDKIHQVNYREKLSIKECSLIIGFLVKNKIDFSFPSSPESVIEFKNRTYILMKELQLSFNSSQLKELSNLSKQYENENPANSNNSKEDIFAKYGGMVEPMFYAGDGVYDFQYLEFLEKKYKYDKSWLLQNKNFDIECTAAIVRNIKSILHKKSLKVLNLDLKSKFPEIVQKLAKKLKKNHTKDEIAKIEEQQFQLATFYQYRNLFKKNDLNGVATEEDWHYFYRNLLELFTIKDSNFTDKDSFGIFVDNFSFKPDGKLNQDYQGPGYFNILNEKPVIEMDCGKYFVPINYLVSEAVYESPFYWLFKDELYKNTAAENRGKVGEEIAYEFLSKVFGEENTFKSVLVESKKGSPSTDIDVLCVLGNKALCVQVKSKRVTLNAKKGEFEQLKKDFKGAVQDAFNQGLICRSSILSKGVKLVDSNKKELHLNKEIDEVYIMSLTTENHPSLVHQARILLKKDDKAPFPLALTVFDLELLVHYLPDPFDFLYYLRQRINLMDYFFADEEFCYLGYHLRKKLGKIDGYDICQIDNDFAGIIDRNYYPFKAGLSHLISTENDPVHNRWKDPSFDKFTNIIKNSKHPKAVDIIFNILDWSVDARENMVKSMVRTKESAITEKSDKSVGISTDTDFGVSYQVFKNNNLDEINDKVSIYAMLKKYQLKCNSWLGLGAFNNSPNFIDFFVYNDESWEFDSELELACNDFFKNKLGHIVIMNNKLPPSRNGLCPCNSGLKYKKCCWNKRKVISY